MWQEDLLDDKPYICHPNDLSKTMSIEGDDKSHTL